MKYVISDKNEVATGNMLHMMLASGLKGKIVRAGHFQKQPDGSLSVWGMSIGFSIVSKSDDANLLSLPRVEMSECCHAKVIEGFKDDPRDHHNTIPISRCEECNKECDAVEIIQLTK